LSLTWISDPNRAIAQYLRRDIRAHRREKGRDGHRFHYSEIKELHAGYPNPPADGELPIHIVLTHHDDSTWQHWAHHHEKGWLLCTTSPTRAAAMELAESHTWELEEIPPPESGLYVLAGWPHPDEELSFTMRVRCHSKNIAITVADVLRSLGCHTSQEVWG
jgi:hypothetical protein